MKYLIPILLIFVFIHCKNRETVVNPYESAIDSTLVALDSVMAETKIPGLGVAVMVDGELVFSKGLGYSDLENEDPVDPATTLFRIGSVSKSMTSLALGKLHEQGKLHFDSMVQVYVPDFPEKKYPITVSQVAGHIAGIRHYRGNEMMSDQHFPTVAEGLDIFKDDSLLFEPGTNYRYSSYGWNLLSAVVEGASGEEFLTYMQENVFDPLGLENTKPDYANREIPGRTKFYYLEDGENKEAPYVDNSYKWAGGGFIASCEDLAKFGNSMLEPSIISVSTVDLLTKSLVINDTAETNYGIGWRSGKTDEGDVWFGHSGGSVGGITQLVIYPESRVVVGLTTNASDVNYGGVQHQIARWFSEGKPE